MLKIKKMKGAAAVLAVMLAFALAGCGTGGGDTSAAATQTTATASSAAVVSVVSVSYSSKDTEDTWDAAEATVITLDGDTATVTGEGATSDGSVVTISAAGTYVVSGELTNGQIVVDVGDEDAVHLALNGASIACENDAPIRIESADKVVLTLADGTANAVSDSGTFDTDDENAPAATIYSHDDLTINGSGSLTVTGQCGGGIACNDTLKIVCGTINVTSAGDGLKGKDGVAIKDGTITLIAGADGIESTNGEEEGKGYIAIEGGTLDITAGLDGIQAQTSAYISGGDLTITSGGGSGNSSYNSDSGDWGNWGGNNPFGQQQTSDTSTDSAKGIKAVVDVTITGGTLIIDSSDDALHSSGSMTINGGNIAIASGDDGAHADETLVISGGSIDITQSYEGIESASITISGGETRLNAADDGVNTAGGNDSSSTSGRPGQNNFGGGMNSGSNPLLISGGYLVVVAAGDGIDANGPMTMTGGTVLVCGPTDNGNGALDFVSCDISGGLLIAAGSSGMALAPDDTSSQYSVMVTLDSTQNADTLFSIVSSSGDTIVSFAPSKQYVNVVVCSPDLVKGKTYTIVTGGSNSGSETDGLYTGGSISGGTEQDSFKVSSILTTIGTAGSMNGGMGGPGRG